MATANLQMLLTCLWPGLAPLWWRGRWSGLWAAIGFAVGFNVLLVVTLVWPDWVAPPWPKMGWFVLGSVWLVGCWRSFRKLPTFVDERPDATEQALFTEAQTEYLKGNWYDAEKLIERLLARRPRDCEALLLLATLYRHTERNEEAVAALDRLEKLTGSGRWKFEITSERNLSGGRKPPESGSP